MLSYFILGVYLLGLTYITVYCLMQFNLLLKYRRKNRKVDLPVPTPVLKAHQLVLGFSEAFENPTDAHHQAEQDWPIVTVQLPIFNERYVIERLIDKIAAFDYPKEKLQIHILDDSTDDTLVLTAKKVAEYQAKGFWIEQIKRKKRQGYKAGALRDGMPLAEGEFIAIFDADFLPNPDFLKQTIPHFKDEQIGVVQTRWEHINQDYSLLTKLQALQLNVHFTVEQVGRMKGNYFLQFNGTAGVWRRRTIEEAGGWEADTLTEDLDLSIRAQLKGWKFKYLEEIGSPAELPAEMSSFKSQQHRWMKGGAETAKKMLPTVWRSNLSLDKKIHATSHLLSSTIFLFVFITGVFSVPLLFLFSELNLEKDIFAWFMVGLLSIIAVYYAANVQAPVHRDPWWKALLKFLFLFPLFLALSMGLSLHNSIAVIQGYRGKQSPFVRTPKFNIQTIKDSFRNNKYIHRKLSLATLLEGLLAVYFAGAVYWGLQHDNTTFLLYHLLLSVGFGAIFYYTLKHLSL